jgi:hypothetical protein
MRYSLSTLGPALFIAVVTLVATALVVAVPGAPWIPLAAALLLVLALVGTDLAQRRRSGAGSRPSPAVLILAATLLVAGLVLSGDRDGFAAMLPILGSCAALPFILRLEGPVSACRWS